MRTLSMALVIDLAYIVLEIYRIVSSKALDNGDTGQNPIGDRKPIELTKTAETDTNKGKCC